MVPDEAEHLRRLEADNPLNKIRGPAKLDAHPCADMTPDEINAYGEEHGWYMVKKSPAMRLRVRLTKRKSERNRELEGKKRKTLEGAKKEPAKKKAKGQFTVFTFLLFYLFYCFYCFY